MGLTALSLSLDILGAVSFQGGRRDGQFGGDDAKRMARKLEGFVAGDRLLILSTELRSCRLPRSLFHLLWKRLHFNRLTTVYL